MSVEVTIESVVKSFKRWTPDQIANFNDSDTPWNITGQVQEEGEVPNTVEQVLNFIGNELSDVSYQIVTQLRQVGIKLGFAATHNPCF